MSAENATTGRAFLDALEHDIVRELAPDEGRDDGWVGGLSAIEIGFRVRHVAEAILDDSR